jgi:hypothetical protein
MSGAPCWLALLLWPTLLLWTAGVSACTGLQKNSKDDTDRELLGNTQPAPELENNLCCCVDVSVVMSSHS